MTLGETLINVFFRLLNFVVLVGVLRYLYKQYVYGAVQRDFEADEKKVAILAQQKDAYYQQEQFLKQEIQNQDRLVTHLHKKLAQWNEAAQQIERENSEMHDTLQAALRKKAVVQSEHIAHYMLERRALPQAMHELETSLAEYFRDAKRGDNYMKSVVNHLEKDR